jgi:hypothetical protein
MLSCIWVTLKMWRNSFDIQFILFDLAEGPKFGALLAIPAAGRLDETIGGRCVVSGLLPST